jgi:hypothetical protein
MPAQGVGASKGERMVGMRVERGVAFAMVGLLVAAVAGCSSGDDSGAASSGSSSSARGASFKGEPPTEVSRPTNAGNGINHPQPSPPLPPGYTEEELFVGGTATRFDAVSTPTDGRWTVKPAKTSPYRTRVIVRRPSAEHFSGTVVVEWLNVSAIEASPDWAYLSQELGREGDAYIAVSAQAQGVNGGTTLLNVNADKNALAHAGVAGAADKSGLRHIDPARYGALHHPGDAYSFDIFSQVGRAAAANQGNILGDLKPKRVLAAGESQSAGFLSTLVDAVHPLDPVFDGFLIHSRGAYVAPLDGNLKRPTDEDAFARATVRIRTDLHVPVFIFETETDLTLLGYAAARQPDTELIRTWEVAGTSHADAHHIRSVIGGPRDPSVGSLVGCSQPINIGPQHEVMQAAYRSFARWASGGPPPPRGERIELADTRKVAIKRDANQIALGGVRNPLVDVPVVATIGDPPGGATIKDLTEASNGVCLLFGQTIPFDHVTLLALHGSADSYITAFKKSAADAVSAGYLLQPDADELIGEAEANRALFGA